jgi:hypothetical protein
MLKGAIKILTSSIVGPRKSGDCESILGQFWLLTEAGEEQGIKEESAWNKSV